MFMFIYTMHCQRKC